MKLDLLRNGKANNNHLRIDLKDLLRLGLFSLFISRT